MNDRFYCSSIQEDEIDLKEDEFHHLRVMRVRIHEEIDLVDGSGTLARACVTEIHKNRAHLTILQRQTYPRPRSSIIIAMALIRMERLEWAIEKGTELDAEAFYLFPADYSEKKSLSPHQLERLRHIAIAALKQCGRLYLPEIVLKDSLQEALPTDRPLLYGDTDPAAPSIRSFQEPRVIFVSGPEKGFSSKETKLLQEHGQGVKLHDNILRAETAPIVVLSLLGGIEPAAKLFGA